jgi:hypothetical protein
MQYFTNTSQNYRIEGGRAHKEDCTTCDYSDEGTYAEEWTEEEEHEQIYGRSECVCSRG